MNVVCKRTKLFTFSFIMLNDWVGHFHIGETGIEMMAGYPKQASSTCWIIEYFFVCEAVCMSASFIYTILSIALIFDHIFVSHVHTKSNMNDRNAGILLHCFLIRFSFRFSAWNLHFIDVFLNFFFWIDFYSFRLLFESIP